METKFNQLCVWQGVLLDGFTHEEFENFMLERFGVRIKFETEIKTNPDLCADGEPIPLTGGRNDVFFFVHDEDILRFAVPRLQAGIRWWEDVVRYNDNSHLYPLEVLNKYPITW